MTTSTKAPVKAAPKAAHPVGDAKPFGSIAPYRVHVWDIAKANGWAVKQTTNTLDTFTKGELVISAAWATNKLAAANMVQVADGKTSPLEATEASLKLQALWSWLTGKQQGTAKFSKATSGLDLAALKLRVGEIKTNLK